MRSVPRARRLREHRHILDATVAASEEGHQNHEICAEGETKCVYTKSGIALAWAHAHLLSMKDGACERDST